MRLSLSLSHESLLLAWPRLSEWIEADRASLRRHQQLTADAQQWDSEGRDDDALWRGLRLDDTQRWLAAHPERARDLNRTEREFLTASVRLESRRQAETRLRMRRTRQLLVAVSVFAVLACLLAGVAGVLQERSSRAEHHAAHQRDSAQSRQLAIEAAQLQAVDPPCPANSLSPASGCHPRQKPAPRGSIHPPSRHQPGCWANPGPTPVALSHDGSYLAMGNAVTGAVQLFRLRSGSPVPSRMGTVPGGGKDARLFALAFAPHAAVLATGGQDSMVRLWDLTQPASPRLLGVPLSGVSDAVETIAFLPDGRLLAVGGGGHALLLWNVIDPAHPVRWVTLAGMPGVVHSVAFSPDGTVLAAAGENGMLSRWHLRQASATLLPAFPQPPPATTIVNSVAFSPDGSLLAAGSDHPARVPRSHRRARTEGAGCKRV